MTRSQVIESVYLICAVCFILALKGLSSPKTARTGNLIGAGGNRRQAQASEIPVHLALAGTVAHTCRSGQRARDQRRRN